MDKRVERVGASKIGTGGAWSGSRDNSNTRPVDCNDNGMTSSSTTDVTSLDSCSLLAHTNPVINKINVARFEGQPPPYSTLLMESLSESTEGADALQSRLASQSFSPEDTLNNDFFFDDEFTVPFDANLAEGFHSGDESTEEGILYGRGSTGGPAGKGSTAWKQNGVKIRMCESKSESYHADMSNSDRMSTSERESGDERVCSPDLSEQLRHQPLFSSQSEACDVKPSDSLLQSCLSGSFSYDGGENGAGNSSVNKRIDCYNWSLNKKRYFLSFDKSPSKTAGSSTGDEDQQSTSGASGDSRVVNWATTAASRRKGSSGNNSSTENVAQKKSGKSGKSSSENDSDKSLTTWKQVKSNKSSPDSSKKLTTWSKISRNSDSSDNRRNSGSSDSDKQSNKSLNTDIVEGKPKTQSNVKTKVKVKEKTEQSQQTAEGKLLNIYTKSKSVEAETAERENSKTQEKAEKRKSCPVSADKQQRSKSKRHSHNGEISQSKQNSAKTNSVESQQNKPNQRTGSNKQKTRDGFKSRSHSRSVDQCIQTSLILTSQEMANKGMQTSLQLSGLSAHQRSLSGDPPRFRHRMMYSAGSLFKPLPDLSFLNKDKQRARSVSKSVTERIMESDEFKIRPNTIAKSSINIRGGSAGADIESGNRQRIYAAVLRCKSVDQPITCQYKSNESPDCSTPPAPVPSSYRQRSRSSDSASSGAYSGCSVSSSGIYNGAVDAAGRCTSGGMTSASSSSSGIASGSDSGFPNRRHSATRFSGKCEMPRKPLRLFTTLQLPGKCCKGSESTVVPAGSDSVPVVIVCNSCNARNVFANQREYAKAMSLSHPLNDKKLLRDVAGKVSMDSSDEVLKSLKSVEYLQISPVRSRNKHVRTKTRSQSSDGRRQPLSPRAQRRMSQPHPGGEARPAKSILVRNRRSKAELKHRSWSEPRDMGDTSSDDCRRRRPESFTDVGDAFEPSALSVVEEKLDEKLSPTGALDSKQSWHSLDSVAKNEANAQTTWSSTHEDDDVRDYDRFRAKKSVSFSEKIFYHSSPAGSSPQEASPSKHRATMSAQTLISGRDLPTVSSLNNSCEFLDMKKLAVALAETEQNSELPPNDFLVSPPSTSPTSSPLTCSLLNEASIDFLHKRELVLDVMKAVELIMKHFTQTENQSEQMTLGNSTENVEVGRLVFEQLCPALQGIMLDGLKPNVSSLFGKVKNSPWRVAEDSAETAQTVVVLQSLVKSLKSLKFLNTPWLLFNSFIAGLLNYRALDFWLTYIHTNRALLSKHYTSNSFLALSTSMTQKLFLDLITSLRPLTQLPLRLDYGFEKRLLDKRHQQHFSLHIRDHPISRSLITHMETQPYLSQWDNMAALNEIPEYDEYHAPQWRKKEDEGLTSSGIALAKTVLRGLGRRQPRPLSLPGNFLLNATLDKPALTHAENDEEKTPTNEAESAPRWSVTSESAEDQTGSGLWQQLTRGIKDFTSVKERINSWRGSLSLDKGDSSGIQQQQQPSSHAAADSYSCSEKSYSGSESSNSPAPSEFFTNSVELYKHSSERSHGIDERLKQRHSSVNDSSNTSSNDSSVQLRDTSAHRKGRSRWSDFGVNLVKFVDKLLLSDSAEDVRGPVKSQSYYGDMSAYRSSCDESSRMRQGDVSRSRSEEQINEIKKQEQTIDTEVFDSRFYTALCHYIAMDDAQLSFEKGTIFAIVKEVDADWLMCRHGNQEGLVHRACITPVCRSAAN